MRGAVILCSLRRATITGDLHQTWKLEKRGDLAGAGLCGWGRVTEMAGTVLNSLHLKLPRVHQGGDAMEMQSIERTSRGKRVCVAASLATPATLPAFPPQGQVLDQAVISLDPQWVAHRCSGPRMEALVPQQPEVPGGEDKLP